MHSAHRARKTAQEVLYEVTHYFIRIYRIGNQTTNIISTMPFANATPHIHHQTYNFAILNYAYKSLALHQRILTL